MPKYEDYSMLPHRLSARVVGAGILTLAMLAGCGSSSEKYIDCLTNPGGSVSGDLDMSKPGEKTVLGDRHQRPSLPEVGTYDDTYKIEVLTTSNADGVRGENILMASSNSGASPLGQGGTLKEIRDEPNSERLLFHNPRQPGQDPPYYRLTAQARPDGNTVVHITYSCDQNQLQL
jgi:hypothetical protein